MSEEIKDELSEEQLREAKDKIIDNKSTPDGDGVDLPSDEDKKYANNFGSIDELKKGITNLKSDTPEYMLNGMNDEALEQYYIDLRKEFSGRKVDNEDKKDDNNNRRLKEDDKKDVPKDDEYDEATNDKLLGAIEMFKEDGNLTNDMYDELNKMGLTDDEINQVIDENLDVGQEKEVVTEFQPIEELVEIAGSADELEAIRSWGENNLSIEEQNAFLNADVTTQKIMALGIKAKYDARDSDSEDRFRGSNVNNVGSEGYATKEGYMLDRLDKQYRTDKKYKAKVDKKFYASEFGK